MRLDGVSALALILIASFGIDRIVTGFLFLLSFVKPWTRLFPDPALLDEGPEHVAAVKKQKLLYFTLAGVLGGVVLAYFGEVRIFRALGFTETNTLLDAVMTGLIMMAGADRVAQFLRMGGVSGGGVAESRPVEITGRLILEGEHLKIDASE